MRCAKAAGANLRASRRSPTRRAERRSPTRTRPRRSGAPARRRTRTRRRRAVRSIVDSSRLRREHLVPRLEGASAIGAEPIGPAAVLARWRLGDGAAWTLACNLGAERCALVRPAGAGDLRTANAGEALANGSTGRTRDRRVPGAVPWMRRSASLRAKPASRTTGSIRRRAAARRDRPVAQHPVGARLPAASAADVAESRARLRKATSGKDICHRDGRQADRVGGLVADKDRARRAVARDRRDERDHRPGTRRRGSRAADVRARLSSPARRGPRDHARGRAAALRHVR